MGIIPLQFIGTDRKALKLDGTETFDIVGLKSMKPQQRVDCTIRRKSGTIEKIQLQSRIDTETELEYYRHGGILHYVLRQLAE